MRVLVVLPTYNEASNVPVVLRRVRGVLPTADVLVVDDASPDRTAALAEAVGEEIGGVTVMRRDGRQGYGPAVTAGIQWALGRHYDVVVQMDADLSHDPADVPSLVLGVEQGADFVLGSRYVAGGSIPDWPWYRRALSRWGGRYAMWMLNLPVRDVTTGFRALRREALEKLDLDGVRADGYGYLIEMLYRLHHAGAECVEVPIVFRDRTAGRSKMSWRIVLEAFVLVTAWGLRDRWRGGRLRRRA